MASFSRSIVGGRMQISSVTRRTACLCYQPAVKALSTRSISHQLIEKRSYQNGNHSRSVIPRSTRTAAFHGTSRQLILPPPPQRIDGTVNDPTPIPPPSPTHGSYHWTFERLLSAALIPLTVAPFATGSLNPVTDATLAAAILIHSHIGFQSIIIDYVPENRLPRARKAFYWALRGATLVVAIGLYEFETNDVGLTEAVKRIWRA